MKKFASMLLAIFILTSCNLPSTMLSDYISGGATVGDNITEITVTWTSGKVDIVTGGDAISFSEDGDYAENDKLCYRAQADGVLYINYAKSANPPEGKHLTVTVPDSAKLRVLFVDTVSADVTIDGVKVGGMLEITTVSGNVNADIPCALSKLMLTSVSGGTSLTVGEIGEAIVSSTSGDVTVTSDSAPKKASFDLGSANGTIVIPSGCGLTVSLTTVDGVFSSDFSAVSSGNVHKIGSGSAKIVVRSISGNFTVKENKE